jgi:hypothetical protein
MKNDAKDVMTGVKRRQKGEKNWHIRNGELEMREQQSNCREKKGVAVVGLDGGSEKWRKWEKLGFIVYFLLKRN